MNLLITARLLVAAQELLLPWALLERAEAALRLEGETLPMLCATVFLKNAGTRQESLIADLSDDGSHAPFMPAPGWGVDISASRAIGKRRGDSMLSLADEIAGCLPRLPAPTPAWMRPRSQSLGYPASPMPFASFFSRGKGNGHA